MPARNPASPRARSARPARRAARAPRLLETADLIALSQMGASISAQLAPEPIFYSIVESARRHLTADTVSVMLADPPSGRFRLAAQYGLPAAARGAQPPLEEGIAGWVLRQVEPVLLHGRVQDPRFTNLVPKDRLIVSAISVPLVAAGTQLERPLGVINVSRTRSRFTKHHVSLLTALAAQAAVALANAQVFGEMQERARTLATLVEVGYNLNSELDLNTVLRSILDKALLLLGCAAGSLLLVDDETGDLIFKIAMGPTVSEQLADQRLPAGTGIAGAVARTGQPMIVQDAQHDPRHYRGADTSTGFRTQSLVAVPLINKGRTIGIIELLNKHSGPFDGGDIELLSSFAPIAAIALENARLYHDLKNSFTDTLRVILNAVEARDRYTAGHVGRVTRLAQAVAHQIGLPRERWQILEMGALLHDIGKIGVSDSILNKPGGLTDSEYEKMKTHPLVGANLVEGVKFLRPVIPVILSHQEKFDGTGYPYGLYGEQIPLEARIISVVDAFDALTSDRPYRAGIRPLLALQEIDRFSGSQFDPQIVGALHGLWENGQLSQERLPVTALDLSTAGAE